MAVPTKSQNNTCRLVGCTWTPPGIFCCCIIIVPCKQRLLTKTAFWAELVQKCFIGLGSALTPVEECYKLYSRGRPRYLFSLSFHRPCSRVESSRSGRRRAQKAKEGWHWPLGKNFMANPALQKLKHYAVGQWTWHNWALCGMVLIG